MQWHRGASVGLCYQLGNHVCSLGRPCVLVVFPAFLPDRCFLSVSLTVFSVTVPSVRLISLVWLEDVIFLSFLGKLIPRDPAEKKRPEREAEASGAERQDGEDASKA